MQALWHSFQEGGWAMYPVFVIGLIVIGVAGRFALRGEHQLLAFIRWLLGALLATGAFGFIIGMMRALRFAVGVPDPLLASRLVQEGLAEAGNNLSGALMFTIVACLGTAVGHRRFPQPNPSAVPR